MLEVAFLRVKEDKVKVLKEWMEEIRRREDEVLETFRNEGTRHEAAYLLQDTAGGAVLVYAQETVDPKRAHQAFGKSELPIDREHRQVMENVIAGRLEAEELLNLSRPRHERFTHICRSRGGISEN